MADVYPIIDQALALSEIDQRLAAGSDVLGTVVAALGDAVDGSLAASQAGIDAIQSKLLRSVSAQIGANTKTLSAATAALSTASNAGSVVQPAEALYTWPSPVTILVDCNARYAKWVYGTPYVGTDPPAPWKVARAPIVYSPAEADQRAADATNGIDLLKDPKDPQQLLCPLPVVVAPPPVTTPPPEPKYDLWVDCGSHQALAQYVGSNPGGNWRHYTVVTQFATAQAALDYYAANQYAIEAALCPPIGCPPPPPCPVQPPPPPCPPPPPPPPAPAGCDLPAVLQSGLPKPGSPQWCQAQQQIHDGFVQLGNWIIDWASGKLDGLTADAAGESSWGSWVDSVLKVANPATVGAGILQAVGKLSGGYGTSLKEAIRCWVQVVKVSAWCAGTEIVALSVVRTAIRFLHKLRVGNDAVLWLTVDIEIDVEAAEMALDYLIKSACPVECPSAPEAIDAWLFGQIDTPTRDCWLLMRGCDPDVWQPVIYARREKLTPEQTIEWARRHDWTPAQIDVMLRRLGFVSQEERDAVQGLYDELPSIQDHLHWLQRNVFDTQYIADYGLLEGFSTADDTAAVLSTIQSHGVAGGGKANFWAQFGHDLRALGMKQEYAALHYAAHWVQPSPGQLQEMLQRLRPGRAPAGVQFTETDYLRLLAEQDVAPYFRQRMRAVAYSAVALRFLRQLYDTAQVDDNELVERFQDLGYSQQDASLLVASERVNREKRRATQGRGVTPGVAAQLYLTGEFTKDDIAAYLSPQGWTRQETDRLCDTAGALYRSKLVVAAKKAALSGYARAALSAYATGTAGADAAKAALVRAGYDEGSAQATLQLEDVKVSVALGKKVIAAVRKSFLRGELDAATAVITLQQGGITPQRSAQAVAAWQLELTPHRQQLATGKVLEMVKRGLLSTENASQRLANLGWSNPDILLLVDAGVQDFQKAQQAALAIQQRQSAARAKAAQQLIKDMDSAKKRLQSSLAKDTPPAKLIKWYGFGTISEETLVARLKAIGYDDIAVSNMVVEAKNAREKCDAKKAKGKPC